MTQLLPPKPSSEERGGAPSPLGDLGPALMEVDVWTDDLVAAAGIPVVDVPLVSVGGGLGSFILVDFLRVQGMPAHQIKVLTGLDYPWQNYEYLTRCSQIPPSERLRSDSSSMPDCLWGFPSYALREAWREKTVAPIWNVVSEPILCNYWTPRAVTVFKGLRREADRIGYWETVVKGMVRVVRRRQEGGYFTIHTPPQGSTPTPRVAFRSIVVHLAVGYPGLKYLPDLQAYRQKYGASHRVVNAYEPHEHVYDDLINNPGVVLVRGAGIVASRILQRLIDDRDRQGAQTRIVHVFRTFVDGHRGPNIFNRRPGGDGWAYQGFNYPKSAWGGQLWARCRRLEGEERLRLYQTIGGTTTARRGNWARQLAQGRIEGWYRTCVGEVRDVTQGPGGTVVTHIHDPADGLQSPTLEVAANYIIDCTGLEGDIMEHRVIADLLQHSGAGRNVLNRLDVERSFEVRGTRSAPGRMYATGAMTLGGYFPGVDTFLGLQLAAGEVTDDLAGLGVVRRMGPIRSVSQWSRWARGVQP